MKLSEMSTEKAMDAMLELVEPIGNIANDKQIGQAFKRLTSVDGPRSLVERFSEIYGELVPLALKTHREDAIAILAAITGKTRAAIKKQSILVTMTDARESVDEELISFFQSWARRGKSDAP